VTPDSLPTAGFSLARLALRTDRDLVSLRRRTRAAGEEFGLDARHVRNLSAATYEVARLLIALRSVDAEIRLGDGPSLQVVFTVTVKEHGEATALSGHVYAALDPLVSMLDGLEVAPHDGGFSVCLRCSFPTGGDARLLAHAASADQTAAQSETEQLSVEELRQRYDLLSRSFGELQGELQETNRGVVALHAELEAQADKLRQAEDRLRLLLDSVQDYAICMLTPHGDIASWNAGAERLFGYAADEMIGRNFACFYQPAEREAGVPAEHLRAAEESGRFACEGLRVRHGGAAFDAHVVLTAVRRGRERALRGFSLVVRDITERKRLEDSLRRRAEELAAANRAKEDFLATLSHELRTPLNAMLGWTRLLRMGKLEGPAMSRALETIERNAHIQEQLIADILDVSRIVTGKLRLELRPIELSPIVHAALDAVRPAVDAKNIRLSAETPFRGTVLGDPDRLQQVVWNLLANAIKFTPAGGRVTVEVARAGSNVAITVTDTGEGISPDLLPFIFDRFTQGDASVTRLHGGLGLGLSIVRHIVELHGGKVHAQSDGEGKGATFSVQLPVRAVPAARDTDPPEPQPNGVESFADHP
jgi:PAS domain S-box-containing protein